MAIHLDDKFLMNRMNLFVFTLLVLWLDIEAQMAQQDVSQQENIPSSYRPTIAVIIGIIAIMISLTFLLFVYARFCNITASDIFNVGDEQQQQGNQGRSRLSGVDPNVIDSLPFFQFSTLKGSKQGLECAVCLSKFEATEILRLLPKCKHAFHIDCIDKWLENHSSCPLCRQRIELADVVKFTYSNSFRFSKNASDLSEDPNVELFVRRELDERSSSRFSVGSSFRKINKGKKNELLIPDGREEGQSLDKFKHKIIVSDVAFNNRWSDLNSSDLLSLKSEMLGAASSDRFMTMSSVLEDGSSSNELILNPRDEMEKKKSLESNNSGLDIKIPVSASDIPSTSYADANSRNTSKSLIPSGKRSMSEITNFSRFLDSTGKNRIKDSSISENSSKEERVRKLWLPIARRTVQWFAGREKRSESQDPKQIPEV